MIQRGQKIFKLIFLLFTMQASMSAVDQRGTPEDRFMAKLRKDIDYGEKVCDTANFALFQITGTDVRISSFCYYIDRVFPGYHKTIDLYVMTITNISGIKIEKEQYMTDYNTCIEEFGEGSRVYRSVGDLFVTHGCIMYHRYGIRDYKDKNIEWNMEIGQRFTEIVIDYFFKNSLEMVKDILKYEINDSLNINKRFVNLLQATNDDKMRQCSNDEFRQIIKNLREKVLKDTLYEKLRCCDIDKDLAFCRLHPKIIMFEKRLWGNRFTGATTKYYNLYKEVTTKRFKNLFKQVTNDLTIKFLDIFELNENRERVFAHFYAFYVKLVEAYGPNATRQSREDRNIQISNFFKNNSTTETIVKYFELAHFDVIEDILGETFQKNRYYGCDDSNRTRIYYEIIPGGNTCETICKVLKDTNTLQNIGADQSIYIAGCNINPRDQLTERIEWLNKESFKDISVKEMTEYPIEPDTLEISLVYNSNKQDPSHGNTQIYRYNRQISKDNDKNCTTYTKIMKMINATFIAIYKNDEVVKEITKGCTLHLLRNSFPKKIEVKYLQVMLPFDHQGSIFIFLVQYKQNIPALSIIFNPLVLGVLDRCVEPSHKQIECDNKNNIPIVFIDNIGRYIDFCRAINQYEFEKRYIFSFDTTSIAYIDETFGFKLPLDQQTSLQNSVVHLQPNQNDTLGFANITWKQMCNYTHQLEGKITHIENLLSTIKLSKGEFIQILMRFTNIMDLFDKTSERYKSQGLDIIVILHADKTFTMNIFDSIEINSVKSRELGPEDLNEAAKGFLSFSHTVDALNSLSFGLGCKKEFTLSCFYDLHAKLQEYTSQGKQIDENELQMDCFEIILKHIKNLVAQSEERNSKPKANCKMPYRLEILALQARIKPFEITLIAKAMVKEILKKIEKRKVRMISIKKSERVKVKVESVVSSQYLRKRKMLDSCSIS